MRGQFGIRTAAPTVKISAGRITGRMELKKALRFSAGLGAEADSEGKIFAAVCDDCSAAVRRAIRDPQATALRHGLAGVHEKIEENLFKLPSVKMNDRIRAQDFFHPDLVDLKFVAQKGKDVFDGLVNANGLEGPPSCGRGTGKFGKPL